MPPDHHSQPAAPEPAQERRPVSRGKLWLFGLVAVLVAVGAVVNGIRARESAGTKLKEWTDNLAVPTVVVATPDARALNPTIDLPGRLEAYSRAPIFARVSGYLKSWSADIGAQVKSGQVIGEIEAPDLDQQLLQARADLASQKSSAKLSEATLNRRKQLLASNFVSQQEFDERSADFNNKTAAVNSGQANVERLEALAGYKNITVPFDGVVTARSTDVGALINAGGSTGPALFVVSDISRLRVYVDVPQSFVPAIKMGAKAIITLPEYPNRTFPATVEASSQSIDVASGTTRMQLVLDNPKRELLPGGYANVKLNVQRDESPLHIPASALIFNKDGLRVATVGADDKVKFKAVKIARDLGRDIELASGLDVNDRFIVAPPDGLTDGDQVKVAGAKDGEKAKKPETASEKQGVKG